MQTQGTEMKRTFLTAAVLATLGTAAHAQMPSPAGMYGELGWSFMKVDAVGTSGRPGALRGILGYEFHPMAAIEGFIGGGIQDDDKNVTLGGNTAEVNFKLKSMYGILLKPKYTMNQLELFARLGWAHTKTAADSSNNAAIASSTQSDDDFAWGLGANFRFSRNWYAGADWMRYSNQSGHKVDGFTLSVGYHW